MYDRPTSGEPLGPQPKPVTLRTLQRMAAAGEPFACLTAYDATTARWLERAGVHLLLVGDSAAQLILGYERTTDMPLEVAVELTAAVKRGAPSTLVMADMPFLTAHVSDEEAIRTAGRFMTQGKADIVKVEADASLADRVQKMTRAGIAVCAHVGLRPQQVAVAGGYRAAGRTADLARRVVEDAVALERAGAVMLLLEAAPPEVTRMMMDATSVPIIGIGAGTDCHAQVLVVQDLLGLSDQPPRFADPVADLGSEIVRAGREWVRRVADREIGGQRYTMAEGEASKLGIPPGEQTSRDERSSSETPG
ncbi:MAG: 3-methyl-2-oxobutanoate hydroxymethyltransferase [Phycisphaerales bacterium JB059]